MSTLKIHFMIWVIRALTFLMVGGYDITPQYLKKQGEDLISDLVIYDEGEK